MTPQSMNECNDIADLMSWYRTAPPESRQRPAFTFYEGATKTRSLDYGALVAAVDKMAAALSRDHGVKSGDAVAVLMANSASTPIVFLAIMSLGAVLVPLNPGATHEDWRYVLRDCRAVGAVASPALLPEGVSPLGELGFVCTPEQLAISLARPVARFPRPPESRAVMLYTSGTTGSPKGVVLSHANIIANARALASHFRLEAQAQLAVMPLFHAHAFGFGLMTALVSGGHLVLADRFNAFHWAGIIAAEDVRVTSLVPPLLPFLMKLKVRAAAVPGLRALLVSSAPLPPEVARGFIAETGLPLGHGWGLSEFTNFATCTAAYVDAQHAHALLCGGALPCVGRPLDGVQVQVRGPHGETLPAGRRGELFVRGPSRMLGYLRRDGSVQAAPEWLPTGDEGYFVEGSEGPLFYVSGRIKDLIIRDAEKLSPLAIEHELLRTCPELHGRLAVVGFEHCVHGEEVGAYVECPHPPGELGDRLLKASREMANGVRPKVILWGAEPVPRTHTGKVQRARLKALFVEYEHYSGPTQIERPHPQSRSLESMPA
jgi:long-chain acyl-CoA synthetase